MNNENIQIDTNVEDDVLMIYSKFKTPYQTKNEYPVQYEYINQFIDLVIMTTNQCTEKIGFISDIEGMKHFLSFVLSSYDDYIIKKSSVSMT